MKVSIITVTFNSQETLQDTIDSIVAQDYADIEHILVDGNSSDKTLEIIKSNSSISKYLSEPDKGMYDALNKGIKMATGDIIGILNSDDVLASENVISKVVEFFKNNQSDVVYGDLVYISPTNNNKSLRYWRSNTFNPSSLKNGWMPPHPTLYCKKSVYDTFGLYNENLKIASDYDFILRLFKNDKLIKSHLPTVMVKMSWGGISNRSIKNIIQKSKEDYYVIRKNKIGGFGTLILKNIRKFKQFLQ